MIELQPSRRDQDFVGQGRIYLECRPRVQGQTMAGRARVEGQTLALKRYQSLARFIGRWP